MTGTADLQEFVAAYLVEAEEHLTVANTQLLAIESAQRDGETNPRAVRETFRSLHTIKGLSAMVGVEPVVAIAHRMENFLRDSDRSGGALPQTAIDALLQGVHAIEQRVAFVLCEVEERTSTEAARIVGAPEATLRTRLFHAKRKLRQALEVEGVR